MAGKNDLYADEIASAKRLLAEKAYDEQPWSEWAGDVVGNAVNTARSILPTALGGKGEVGISDMARGAYEGVKDAVTFPGDVLTGKQALYDEAGRPLEQAVGRSFNTAATMGGASSMAPVPDNALRIFGGVRSRTADKNALTKAQIMESQGASPDEIWKQTGWGRGAEQQWRYDIPDTDAVIRPYNLKDKTSKSGDVYKSATLAELLDHPEFFEAYPEFKTMRVNETFAPDVNGYYLPRFDRGTIKPGFSDPYIALNLKNLPRDESKLSTLLHEVQHAVQQKEGFAPGSNPRNYPDQTPNPMVAVYEKAFWNDPDLKFIRSNLDTADYFDALAGSNKLYKEEFEPLHKQLLKDEKSGIDTTGKYGLITDMAEKASYEKFPILKQIDDAYKALRKKGIPHKRPKEFLEPTEAYRATAGEVEARNVQERMNMSRDELKELAPWHTQESYHPYEGQIIDWNDTSWRKGYSGRGRVAKSIADEAVELAKRLVGVAPEKKTIKGSDLIAKSPGLSEDPFKYSKFSKPLGEMEYTVEKLPNMEAYKELDPHDLVRQNALIAGHISDRTAAGRNLVNVGGVDLVEPLRQRGGADYQRTTLNAWANRPGAAKGLNRKLNEAAGYEWDKKEKMFVPKAEGPEEAPLYTTPVFMGASSANSSHMVGIPLIRMIPNLPISQADKLAFDAMMSQRFPGWPGINKTKEAEEFMYKGKIPGSAISKFVKYAAAKKWKGAGFPDVEEVMFSSMDPRLVGVPQGSTGFGFKEFNPGRTPIIKTNDYHPDYPAAIPGKEYAGGFRYQVPQSLLLPDWWKSLSPELRDPANATKAQHTLMTQVPIQRVTPEWADNILKYWEENPMPWGYADGGEVDDDIDDAIRIAKDVGGSTPVLMEDAKGNKYDAKGNIIPPQNPGPNPARSDATPQSVAAKAVNDPATYDALMERYAVPDRDIAEYEALKATVGQQPQDIRQMTHVGDRPRREVAVDMPLFGGEYSMGTAPYDVASGMQGAAQTAYDLKTAPFYFNPITAPIAAGMDLAEGIATNDPLTASLAVGFGPGGKYAKAAGIGAVNYFMDPAEAQAGPERWFSKLYRSAEALPMEKMTGEQALAMLRKTAPQEEIKWTGLEGFASENPVTTKKALLDFLKRNQVQTQDVVLGGPKADVPAEIKEKWAALVDRKNEIVNQIVLPPNERTRPWDELMAEQESVMREMDEVNEQANKFLNGYTPTRYGPGSQFGEKYMTPGGENYQETLITLPARDIYTPYIGALRDEAYNSAYKEAIASGIAEDKAADFAEKLIGKMQPYQHARIVNKTKELNEITLKQEMLDKAVYKSQHWDEKNVIGHIRSQMLTANPPGANRPLKLFNVDENQSDLGQAGRKQGFVTIEDRMNYPNMGKQYDAMNAQRRKLETLVRYGDDANPEVQVASGQLAELDRQMQALSDKMASIRGGGVPAAPYVTSTQGWTDFSIKKALDQAIDSGADYFTFTPGEVQAKRYSLRNEVQGLAYDPEEKTLSFYPKDGRGWQDVSETIPPEDLKKYIGEEASKKLLAQEPNSLSGNQILEGIDLEFGGEGMIDYYNNIYKKRVEKVVKDLTGKKIQWEVLPAETSEGIVPRLGFRIDDDLREAKFPTFASGGVVNKALQLTRDY